MYPDIERIYFFSDPLNVVALHQDLGEQYLEMELPQVWGTAALRCYMVRPFCINLN